jgi:aminoglycoside 3-N-acetyltransferase
MSLAFRQFKYWFKSILPAGLKKLVKKIRAAELMGESMEKPDPISLSEFEKALYELGVTEGQVLFVHSSADKSNSIEGGAGKILHLLLGIIGPSGTLVLPTFTFDGMAADYLKQSRFFDVKKTPSRVGLLSEIFRRMPGVLRSIHPTHPVAAFGKEAQYFVSEHHLDIHPFGSLSPFKKMEKKQGNILMIGVDSTYLTHMHTVEDTVGEKFPYKVYLDEIKEVQIKDSDGSLWTMQTLVHNPKVTRFKNIVGFEKEWLEMGLMKKHQAGNVELRLFDMTALSEIMVKWAESKKTIYG